MGLLLQLSIGPVEWDLFAAPVNIIVLVLLCAAIGLMYAFRHRVYAFSWMMHYQAAVPCLCWALGMTLLMGLTPQMREGGIPWLSQMLQCWPFVLIWLWLVVIVGLTTVNHLAHFSWKEIPFILNHLGVFVAVVCATLGSADMQKLQMSVKMGTPEWRGQDEDGNLHELNLAIDLHSFTIDEYPPKLMLVENSSGTLVPDQEIILEEGVVSGHLLDWNIKLLQQLPEAAAVDNRYERWNSVGATYAVEIQASRGDSLKTGWVSCGSYAFPHRPVNLDARYSLVMPEREPRRYASDVSVYTEDGRHIHGVIEVNRPMKVDGWKIYQLSYDERLGKWSDVSVFELVRDPWLPLVYLGIFMMLAGALCLMFFMAPKPGKL